MMLSSLIVKERALDLGFDLAGIAPLEVWKDLEFSREWVGKGFHGEMRYLENPKRFDPLLVLPSARSVICVGLVYNAPFAYSTDVDSVERIQERESGRLKAEGSRSCPCTDGQPETMKCHSERSEESRSALDRPPQKDQGEIPRFARNDSTFQGRRQKKEDETNQLPFGRGAESAAGSNAGVIGGKGPWTTDNGRLPFSDSHFPVFAPAPRAWISRYAWGHDYHEVMRAKLEQLRDALEELAPSVETRVFVDTGPVVERAFARFSGIGWMGKNTCIINEEKGSWFFLGVILTSLELAPDLPAPDRCGSCTACLEACPTGALVEPYVMDASRCISYLTIELRGSIPEEFRPKMAGNVFGCDICQDVCPWNGSRQPSVFSYQQATSRQPRPRGSHQPSAISYQPSAASPQVSAFSYRQSLSPQSQSLDERRHKQVATTNVPEFHPMTVALDHPRAEDGRILKQLTTDNGPPIRTAGVRTTDDGQGTTDNGPRTTDAVDFSLFHPPLEALASISEEDFRRTFAHSPIKRAKYRGWLRNLAVAMGNSGDQRFLPWLEKAAQHSDPVVREHARWAIERLRSRS